MESPELKKIIETLLFITDTPLSIKRLAAITEEKEEIIKDHLTIIKDSYDSSGNALQIRQVAGGWQMATRPQYGQWVRKLYSSKMTVRLTQAALETLCIVAYKQPITRAEIEAVRGVDSVGPLETLTQRRLITVTGRKEVAGRPLLYGTTQEFLRQFGLNSLKDLPKLETFNIENPALNAQSTAAELADEAIKEENAAETNAAGTDINAAETYSVSDNVQENSLFDNINTGTELNAGTEENKTTINAETVPETSPIPAGNTADAETEKTNAEDSTAESHIKSLNGTDSLSRQAGYGNTDTDKEENKNA